MDNLKRKIFIKYELKKIVLSSLIHNSKLPISYRYFVFYQFIKQPRWGRLVQQRNRCIKSGRVWNVMQKTRYSRFVFRTEAYEGNLPGFKRASW